MRWGVYELSSTLFLVIILRHAQSSLWPRKKTKAFSSCLILAHICFLNYVFLNLGWVWGNEKEKGWWGGLPYSCISYLAHALPAPREKYSAKFKKSEDSQSISEVLLGEIKHWAMLRRSREKKSYLHSLFLRYLSCRTQAVGLTQKRGSGSFWISPSLYRLHKVRG